MCVQTAALSQIPLSHWVQCYMQHCRPVIIFSASVKSNQHDHPPLSPLLCLQSLKRLNWATGSAGEQSAVHIRWNFLILFPRVQKICCRGHFGDKLLPGGTNCCPCFYFCSVFPTCWAGKVLLKLRKLRLGEMWSKFGSKHTLQLGLTALTC